jgi:hypothetical protein
MSRTSKRRPTPSRPGPPPDNPVQSDRFIAKARDIEADATLEIFEQAFRKVAFGQLLKRTREMGRVARRSFTAALSQNRT